MKNYQFTKMHGLGNDFVIIDAITQKITLNADNIRAISDRRLGIGCDQVLILDKSTTDADFNYRIYNADGSEASHCGNGARCLAKFIREKGLSNKPIITLQLPTHLITAEIISDHVIKIAMGEPDFGKSFTLDSFTVNPVSIGNPHAVILADRPAKNLSALGEAFNHDTRFPEGVNVSWALVRNPQHIELSVYERGVGLTMACGSAACATAALALKNKLCEGTVVISMPGGDCTVEWPNKSQLYLSGPAEMVYSGVWHG